jgi:hypothetical protein
MTIAAAQPRAGQKSVCHRKMPYKRRLLAHGEGDRTEAMTVTGRS